MPFDVNSLATNNGNYLSLARNQVEPLYKQKLNFDKFSDLAGKGSGNIIVQKIFNKGVTMQFKTLQAVMDMNLAYGNEVLEGKETAINYDTWQMNVERFAFGHTVEHTEFIELATGLNIKEDSLDLLKTKVRYLNFKRLIQALFLTMCSNTTDPILGQDNTFASFRFTIDQLKTKILACGLYSGTAADPVANAALDNISHQRIMFGADFNNSAAGLPVANTIQAVVTNANFTRANGHGTRVDNFRRAADLATVGNRSIDSDYVEKPMLPFSTERTHMGYFMDKWFVVMSSQAFRDMRTNDPEWTAQLTRGTIENPTKQPSIFRGGAYKGEIDGLIFIVDPVLDKYNLPNNAGNAKVAVSFLLGAGAIAHGIAGSPEVRFETANYGFIQNMGYFETGGIRPILWHSTSNANLTGSQNPVLVPNGIIPVITSLE